MNPRRATAPLLGFMLGSLTLAGLALAQDPKAAAPTPVPASPKAAGLQAQAGTSVANISAFYRLRERYTTGTTKEDPEAVGQTQVAFRETTSTDDPQDKVPRVVQAIFAERPASLSPVDDRAVIDSIRAYSSVDIKPDPWKGRTDRRPLNDLTIWYRTVAGDVPAVMVLSPGRALREEEYKFAINYDFVSNLAFLLPDLPKQVGQTWNVERPGAVALLNDEVRTGNLTAKLVDIRTRPKDPDRQTAIIEITGQVTTGFDRDLRSTAVRAQVDFVFTPAKRDASNIDGFGFIEKLSLAQASTLSIPGQTQTRKFNRKLVLERKNPGDGPALDIPNPAPEMTEENSWLTFTDPKNRYHVRHPQGFQPTFPPGSANVVDLKRYHSDSPDDIVRLEYVEKATASPETSFKTLIDDWRAKGIEVLPGLSERLPDKDWPGMSAYHLEAALTSADPQGGPAVRRYFDAYVIQFARDVTVFVSATTFQEQPAEFRAQVLGLLRTLKLGAPK